MKLSRQAEVKEETLVKAHDPEAFLTQISDTLQASLLRSGQVRAELFSGQAMVVRGATTRSKRDADRVVVIEVTLNIQALAESVSETIDAYTVDKMMSKGELISPDLLTFLEWLKPLDIQPSSD